RFGVFFRFCDKYCVSVRASAPDACLIFSGYPARLHEATPKNNALHKGGHRFEAGCTTLSTSVHVVQSDTTVYAQRSGLVKEP
ncbi:hypothetical protein, partial [Pseudomonas sp.]|uniref:hypothetical protein n=1 Tax=Pseudomonas sp. TaxID=306 RepID=UPI003FD730D0